MSDERVELFTPGCLGTCWYGRYHYMEPWVGCEHDCDYCYARHRSVVERSLAAVGTRFGEPRLQLARPALIDAIRDRLARGDIEVLKLCRYTDFFQPTFVRDGLVRQILGVLVESRVRRVIITTKGVPDRGSVELMIAHADRFSYNVVAKPASPYCLEPRVHDLLSRLGPAAELSRHGVLTTVHMDPIIPGVEDDPAALSAFLDTLQAHRLDRVMFSYLLLCDEMVEEMRKRLEPGAVERILGAYEQGKVRQYLPDQVETRLFAARPDVLSDSVRRISEALTARGLKFVLCSLKNVEEGLKVGPASCPRCDGSFYA